MRIPLLRFRGDATPVAPWEWWFAPVIIPAALALLFLILPFIMLIGYGAGLAHFLVSVLVPKSVQKRWFAPPE